MTWHTVGSTPDASGLPSVAGVASLSGALRESVLVRFS